MISHMTYHMTHHMTYHMILNSPVILIIVVILTPGLAFKVIVTSHWCIVIYHLWKTRNAKHSHLGPIRNDHCLKGCLVNLSLLIKLFVGLFTQLNNVNKCVIFIIVILIKGYLLPRLARGLSSTSFLRLCIR